MPKKMTLVLMTLVAVAVLGNDADLAGHPQNVARRRRLSIPPQPICDAATRFGFRDGNEGR